MGEGIIGKRCVVGRRLASEIGGEWERVLRSRIIRGKNGMKKGIPRKCCHQLAPKEQQGIREKCNEREYGIEQSLLPSGSIFRIRSFLINPQIRSNHLRRKKE